MYKGKKKLAGFMIALAAVAVALTGAGAAAPASASSSSYQGGDGDPSGCANAYTVASAAIYGERGVTAGKQIGVLELRYSSACQANWSRVNLYQQYYSSGITIQQDLNTEGRWTTSSDFGLTVNGGPVSAWGRYLRLANPNSTACVQTWVSSDFGTPNFHTVGASLCSH